MTVAISSRFTGPREIRENGRYEAVLPAAATQVELALQAGAMASKLGAAYERVQTRRPTWVERLMATVRRE